MGKVKKLLLVIAVVVVVAVCLVFVLQNQQAVALNFLTWSSPGFPVSVFVLLGLLLGMLVGPLLAYLLPRSRSRATRRPKLS